MADVDLRIVHTDHNNNTLSIHQPVGDSLAWGYRTTDIGDISYELSLTDDDELVAAGLDSFAAYKTDWRLGMSVLGGAWESIHAGIHTSVGLASRSDTVKVAGKDWGHWLEQQVWFDFYTEDFDPDNLANLKTFFARGIKKEDTRFDSNGFLDGPAYYVWSGFMGANFETMLTNLINKSKVGTDYVNLTAQFEGFSFLESITHYEIIFQDEGTYLDHLKTIASGGEPYGFDFYFNWNKTVNFFGPRKSLTTSPDPIWFLNTENIVVESVPEFDWQNNGPLGTYIYALGPGSPALWKIRHDQDSEDIYRRWFRTARIGDTYNQSALDVEAAATGLQWIFPHKDLNLTIYPNKVNPTDPGDGFRNHVGDVVRFQWEVLPYHIINAFFWITQQDFHGDSAGNWVCDLGLEQIYDIT